jgi:hypothetical protein
MSIPSNSLPLKRLFRLLLLLIVATYLGSITYLWRETVNETRDDLTYLNSFLVRAVRATLNDHELILRGLGTELLADGALEQPEKGRTLIERMKKIDAGMVGFDPMASWYWSVVCPGRRRYPIWRTRQNHAPVSRKHLPAITCVPVVPISSRRFTAGSFPSV